MMSNYALFQCNQSIAISATILEWLYLDSRPPAGLICLGHWSE
jgi:hypothetical protein